jgi:hypothetical protein
MQSKVGERLQPDVGVEEAAGVRPSRAGVPLHRGSSLREGADGREPDVGMAESVGGCRPSRAGAPLRPTGPVSTSGTGHPPSAREWTAAELRTAARDGRRGRTRRRSGFGFQIGRTKTEKN